MRALLIDDKDSRVGASMNISGIEEVKEFYMSQISQARNWVELFAFTTAHTAQMCHKMDYDGVSYPKLVDIEVEKGIYKTIL